MKKNKREGEGEILNTLKSDRYLQIRLIGGPTWSKKERETDTFWRNCDRDTSKGVGLG